MLCSRSRSDLRMLLLLLLLYSMLLSAPSLRVLRLAARLLDGTRARVTGSQPGSRRADECQMMISLKGKSQSMQMQMQIQPRLLSERHFYIASLLTGPSPRGSEVWERVLLFMSSRPVCPATLLYCTASRQSARTLLLCFALLPPTRARARMRMNQGSMSRSVHSTSNRLCFLYPHLYRCRCW